MVHMSKHDTEITEVVVSRVDDVAEKWSTKTTYRVVEATHVDLPKKEIWSLKLSESGIEDPDAEVAICAVFPKPDHKPDNPSWHVRFYWRDAIWEPWPMERYRTLQRLGALASTMRNGRLNKNRPRTAEKEETK